MPPLEEGVKSIILQLTGMWASLVAWEAAPSLPKSAAERENSKLEGILVLRLWSNSGDNFWIKTSIDNYKEISTPSSHSIRTATSLRKIQNESPQPSSWFLIHSIHDVQIKGHLPPSKLEEKLEHLFHSWALKFQFSRDGFQSCWFQAGLNSWPFKEKWMNQPTSASHLAQYYNLLSGPYCPSLTKMSLCRACVYVRFFF